MNSLGPPKWPKTLLARVARDAPRARDFENPREEDATDEEMEDDEVTESEVMFATEMNASPNSDSEAPESRPKRTPEPRKG